MPLFFTRAGLWVLRTIAHDCMESLTMILEGNASKRFSSLPSFFLASVYSFIFLALLSYNWHMLPSTHFRVEETEGHY